MNQLEKARQEINRIDGEMARLFEERMAAVEEVVSYKMERDLAVEDLAREQVVIDKNTALVQREIYRPYYREWVSKTLELSRRYQRHVMGKDRIGYQGTQGAFSHIALRRLFGDNVKEMAYATFEKVFLAVEEGDVAYGVIPFENSYTGEVGEVFDLLFTHPVSICGMYDLPITQNLLGLPGATLQDIRKVYSHHQAISQSQEFIRSLGLEAIPYPNTATAAKFVKETGDKSIGAIASQETAALYGLDVLKEGINTSNQNTTRFIVLCREPQKGGNRFNLLFTVDHLAGSLAGVIAVIGKFGFSLESIKSRPVKNVPWQYYFYVEIIGDLGEEKARQMLSTLEKECKELKLLGSYTK